MLVPKNRPPKRRRSDAHSYFTYHTLRIPLHIIFPYLNIKKMSVNVLNQLRDKAIQNISEGKSAYLNSQKFEDKQQGYLKFKCGIQELLQVTKLETSEATKNIYKEKIKEFTSELEKMKVHLDQFAQQWQQQQQQQFQNQSNQSLYQNQGQSAPNSNSSSISKQSSEEKKQDDGNSSKLKNVQNEETEKLKASLEGAIVTEKPNVKWEDVAGLEIAKQSLQEAVIMPIRFPEIFQGARKPWMGILLYGPPGTGKTFLAKACATECDGTFFSVSSSDLISKFVGESERLIKQLFQMARDKKPSIIFIDEVDSMTGNRDGNETEASRRVKTEFLVQMQGVGTNNEGVLVLGATNLPWALDPAIRRRFEKRIYIPLPDIYGRTALLRNRLKDTPNFLNEEKISELAQLLEGYSGSDIQTLIRDASYEPLRKSERATHFKQIQTEKGPRWVCCAPSDPQGVKKRLMEIQANQLYLPPVDADDFMTAISKCKSSVGQGDLKKYEDWTKEFGQEG